MTAIGVTGHRFLADPDNVIQGIDVALEAIRQVFPSPFILFSSLAEGSDRLVARRAFTYDNTRLIVPLPLRKLDYMAEFLSEGSREEFLSLLALADQAIELPPNSSRLASYEAAGRYILDHCQVLLAIWDGKQARGRGGTGQMISEARQRGLPLAWLRADQHRQDNNPSILSKQPMRVIFERFPALPAREDKAANG
jgi:hypothetical protein